MSPLIELEIYEKVHKLASRIRAAKAQNLSDSDFEYISIIYKLLPESQQEKWVSIAPSDPTWETFFTFLEEVYDKALLKKQINESCKQGNVQDKKQCTNCKRFGHTIENCIKGKVFTTTINTDKCPLCNDALHYFETPYKKVQVQTRLLGCKKFYHVADDEKRDTF